MSDKQKPTGVADAAAHAADIGYAMQMIEGFEPVKLPQWEMVSKDPDGTPIYRDNWGAYDPWIPVEDRLPEGECRCLVAVDGEVRSATYYPPGKFQPEITHWMPLPKPPEVK